MESAYWVVLVEEDLYADMLHIFNIELDSTDISSSRFFSLAKRIMLYGPSATQHTYEKARKEKEEDIQNFTQADADAFFGEGLTGDSVSISPADYLARLKAKREREGS